jgi:hypothetical protein
MIRRPAVAVLAATALSVGTLVAPAQASAEPDPTTGKIAASWITGQLTDGVVHNDQWDFDDLGLSADAAIGLAVLGRRTGAVTRIAEAIEPRAESEWYTSTWEGVTTLYAGSLAKAAVLASTAGLDPRSFGGVDLISRVEGTVATQAPIAGRIEDDPTSGDTANVIGQGFAVRALAEATPASARADDALGFLLQQQCDAGYFRLYFTKDKTADEQGCVDGAESGSEPDTDATALSLINLVASGHDDAATLAALTKGQAWLLDQQRRNGSFGGGATTEGSNTNSTGLAGWALGALGEDRAAHRTATWVRRHQPVDRGACRSALGRELGAIAYDRAALVAARKDGITDQTADQWRRASFQAAPVLRWAPANPATLRVRPTDSRVRAGHRVSVRVIGLAPGEAACLSIKGHAKRVSGRADLRRVTTKLRVPRGKSRRTIKLVTADGTVRATIRVRR